CAGVLCLLYSFPTRRSSDLLLFGVFFLLAVYEFCKLFQISKIAGSVTTLLVSSSFFFIHNSELNKIYLIVLPFSCYLIFDLFKHNFSTDHSFIQKIVHLTGVVIVPFLILIHLHLNNNVYAL